MNKFSCSITKRNSVRVGSVLPELLKYFCVTGMKSILSENVCKNFVLNREQARTMSYGENWSKYSKLLSDNRNGVY